MKDEDYTEEDQNEPVKDNKIKVAMTREQYEEVKRQYLQDKQKGQKKKSFNSFFNFGKRQAMNKSKKSPEMILVFLLNVKKQIEGPLLVKIYSGNFFVIRNKVYRIKAGRVFAWNKYRAVIAREGDRELVGIDDLEKLAVEDWQSKNPGKRINMDDPVLIKALIQAKLSEKEPMKGGLKWIIIIVAIIAVIVGFFLLTAKKSPANPNVIVPLNVSK